MIEDILISNQRIKAALKFQKDIKFGKGRTDKPFANAVFGLYTVTVEKFNDCLEIDELNWFIERKARSDTRENVYLMTMVSRQSRQIVGFDVALDKSAWQAIVDGAPEAEKYCSDGYVGYIDVVLRPLLRYRGFRLPDCRAGSSYRICRQYRQLARKSSAFRDL